MTTPDSPDWLTVAEVARLMRLDPKTIGKYIAAGQMPGRLFGKIYRISRLEYDDYRAGRWHPKPPINVTAGDFTTKRRSA